MSKSPPIPKEQRSILGDKDGADLGDRRDRRDQRTEAQSPDPGDADVNLDRQGRFGNIRQNTTPHRSQQDR